MDTRLLAAHDSGDLTALVDLYRAAAQAAQTEPARAFYLTHAHVFALELGHPDTATLRAALIDMGCETRL